MANIIWLKVGATRCNSEGSHPVSSGQDPGIVDITEAWGDQLSLEATADLGTHISTFLLHRRNPLCLLSPSKFSLRPLRSQSRFLVYLAESIYDTATN